MVLVLVLLVLLVQLALLALLVCWYRRSCTAREPRGMCDLRSLCDVCNRSRHGRQRQDGRTRPRCRRTRPSGLVQHPLPSIWVE